MNPSSLAAAVIFLPPLLAGLAIGLAGRTLRDTAHRLGVPAGAAVCTAAIYMLSRVPSEGPVVIRLPGPDPAVHWLTFGLYVDRLSAVMLVLIALVSLIIQVYSINYVRGDRGYARFYALVNLLTAVLLAMVASANLLMLVMCWQLVSWLLYLLLAYHYPNLPAIRSAWKTWVVQRIGDVAALAGAFLAYKVYGTLEFPALFERAATVTADLAWWAGGPSISAPTAVTLLLLIAAMARSAQLPFHVWLPETMDTPTPVSALMHAGIVNAGGFLINRLAPLYGLAPMTLHVAFMIGGLTAILGAAMMLTQSDIKKALGYSTMGQMGYMTMECGLGAFALAIFHLIAHGIFKATLFLNAGSLIHESRREPHVPPIRRVPDHDGAPGLHWFTGLVMTLILRSSF